jgi:hypothetical protein
MVVGPIGKPRGGETGGATGIVGDVAPGAGAEKGGPGGITGWVVGPKTVPVVGAWVVPSDGVPSDGVPSDGVPSDGVPSDGGGIKVASDEVTGGAVFPGN